MIRCGGRWRRRSLGRCAAAFRAVRPRRRARGDRDSRCGCRLRCRRRPRADGLRKRLNGLSDHEERGVDVFAAQHLENRVGVRRIGTVVVGEGHDLLVFRAADDGASEELALPGLSTTSYPKKTAPPNKIPIASSIRVAERRRTFTASAAGAPARGVTCRHCRARGPARPQRSCETRRDRSCESRRRSFRTADRLFGFAERAVLRTLLGRDRTAVAAEWVAQYVGLVNVTVRSPCLKSASCLT